MSVSSAEKILTNSEKFHICLGLERVSKVLEVFGNPQDELEFVHVAGTNGKGSTCAILASILECVSRCNSDVRDERSTASTTQATRDAVAQGQKSVLKVGLFTSPHLFSYTERIKINGVEISQSALDELVTRVDDTAQKNGVSLTEFEILTVAGFLHFKNEACDIVVLETGLGGRLDSTNVIKRPLVSIITSISLDHTARLGNTIEKIGFEKAGIIKPECPTIVGAKNLALKVIEDVAKEKNTLLRKVESVLPPENFALLGDFQAENMALALEALKFLPFHISGHELEAGLKNVRHKFRMEFDPKRNLLIDGCHNPDGARVLREFLDKNFALGRLKFIYGTLNNKDYETVLGTLIKPKDELCFFEFNSPNALKFEELPPKLKTRARKITDPMAEIAAAGDGELTVVCGSLYMLGEIFS